MAGHAHFPGESAPVADLPADRRVRPASSYNQSQNRFDFADGDRGTGTASQPETTQSLLSVSLGVFSLLGNASSSASAIRRPRAA